MKYTVVIRQPVEPEQLPQLETLLRERIGLRPDQATKLASRRSGRLLKPTGRERAEALRAVFEEVGAQVSLEEVPDESGQTAQAVFSAGGGGIVSDPAALWGFRPSRPWVLPSRRLPVIPLRGSERLTPPA
ncbi:hypothetical protein ACFP81_11550 [Deinococcus lacus]|uniref:Uncharacterized protein n=1 Tax=Deinococcus lacus TaxID=392561 RepID=A0ABW1YAX3_9DEIO